MKISYQWLKELTGLDWSVEEVSDRLTLCGTACEDIIPTARHMDKVVVGEVVDLQPIPGADRIKKAVVDVGDEKHDSICGAPNVAVGQKVAVALFGAELAGGLKVKPRKVRSVNSTAVICAEDELGISADHSGVIVLDTSARPGTPLIDELDFDDYILDFELTPNRGDSMSAIGIARDLAALASVKVKYSSYELKPSSVKAADLIKVSIADSDACPRFTARIIRNVKIGPSPWWVQKKLLTAGIRPISNVVDITNLVMLETGNPIHAFDLDRFGSSEVVVRMAHDSEKLTTLDGKEHELPPFILLITNGKEAKAAAGVMGGLDSEVTDQTTNILLEVAYFKQSVIRKGRKHLGFVSEASNRFEKGVDPNNVPIASAHAASLFHELCGGEVAEGFVDCYPKPIEPITVELRPERCDTVLGTGFGVDRMVDILRSLEFEVSGQNPLKVTVPTFRHDITREIDLIEEIARIEGYNAIPDSIENIGPLFTPTDLMDRLEGEIRQVLTGAGFDEMLGHGLADGRFASTLNPDLPQLKIVNPVSEDLNIMRNSLIQTGLSVVSHNIAHRCLDLRLFEIGKAYFPPDSRGKWREEERLLLMVSGSTPSDWRIRPRPFDFYDLTGAVQRLAGHFHLPELQYEPTEIRFLEADTSFSVMLDDQAVGWIGQIKDEIAQQLDIKQTMFAAELSLMSLVQSDRELVEFVPLPAYPSALRDLALEVDESTRVGDIVASVKSVAGDLAESVHVFDLYVGKQIGDGKKSVGVAIEYRSPSRSLSGPEVDELQEKITADLKQRFKAQVRDK